MRDGYRYGEHNSRQGWNTAGDEREREGGVKEQEGKERSSHRLSIRGLPFLHAMWCLATPS